MTMIAPTLDPCPVTADALVHPASIIHQETLMDGVDGCSEPGPSDEGARPSDAPSLGGVMDDGLMDGTTVSSTALLDRCRLRLGPDVERGNYWGLHVRAGAVTLIVGETSAGKTTFLHRFG